MLLWLYFFEDLALALQPIDQGSIPLSIHAKDLKNRIHHHGRMSSNQYGGAPNFCPKNLSLQ